MISSRLGMDGAAALSAYMEEGGGAARGRVEALQTVLPGVVAHGGGGAMGSMRKGWGRVRSGRRKETMRNGGGGAWGLTSS